MKRLKIVFLIFALFYANTLLFAHSGKARFHVIIDTDCAPDDLRAISLILASADFELLAITTSDGLLSPEEGYKKIKAMLKHFGHEGIPVAYGKKTNKKNAGCNELCLSVNWGNEENIKIPEKNLAVELLIKEINEEEEPVYLICLGPLTNIAELLKNKDIHSQIEQILWYQGDIKTGYNLNSDIEAAKSVSDCHTVNKVFFNTDKIKETLLTNKFLNKISKLNNPYSDLIFESHKNQGIQEKIKTKFYRFWDDLLPLYLINPELFDENQENKILYVSIKNKNLKNFETAYLKILDSKHQYENKVFDNFPTLPEYYAEDIKPYVKELIKLYGYSEFRSAVITNEMHGHFGIYAVVGVKMGIRIRQYFNISLDDVEILSYAGLTTPLSCMNDGLQVGTGGTIGHGLIRVAEQENKIPAAKFRFKDREITLILKDEYWKQIQSDIKKTIDKCGNLTPEYWEELRKYAIKYWLEFDRMEIFEFIEK
ncbi:MAG: nucleoside hydrolase [Bacteroidales bacterium]|nr:nucleoside hydrolase [Bacteroidales bacterium]